MPRKARTTSLADDNAAPGGAAAVDRALTVLSAFQAGDSALSLAELATRTQLYKSTVLRLLASLEHARLLQRLADGRYALGVEVARLHGVYEQSFSLERVVLPVLQHLVAQTGESAAYHVLQGLAPHQTRVCLFRVDSPHPVRDHIRAGDVLPADKGSGALVLMAYNSHPSSAKTVTDSKTRGKLARIRADGYFSAVGERLPEVAGISAPVFKASGEVAAALTLTMPAHRYNPQHIAAVLDAARALSARVA